MTDFVLATVRFDFAVGVARMPAEPWLMFSFTVGVEVVGVPKLSPFGRVDFVNRGALCVILGCPWMVWRPDGAGVAARRRGRPLLSSLLVFGVSGFLVARNVSAGTVGSKADGAGCGSSVSTRGTLSLSREESMVALVSYFCYNKAIQSKRIVALQ